MDIILQENYPSLGYVGDRIVVKGGYARNFLIPRGIAVEASSRSEKALKHRMQHILAKRVRMRSEAEAVAKQLAELKLSFTLKMSEGGKSFGSITSRDIEIALKSKGHLVDRRQIRMQDVLRKAGEYKIPVKLHAEVTAELPIKVESEVLEAKAHKPEGRKVRPTRGAKTQKAEVEPVGVGETSSQTEPGTQD